MTETRVFTNGRIFAGASARAATVDFTQCLVIQGDKIAHVGSETDQVVQEAIQHGAEVTDLNGRIVIPGFIDAHTHLLFFGLSRLKLDLTYCRTLDQIRSTISDYAAKHPELPRILCRGWLQQSGREALATMLDDLDPCGRPIYLESLDLHSSWVNTAALKELPLDNAEKLGNHQVACDENGNPTGLFAEAGQVDIIWPFVNSHYTEEDKQVALQRAFDAYVSSGYSGVIDMAMDDHAWDALKLYRERNGSLPIHVAAHWLITPPGSGGDLSAKIDEAVRQYKEWHPTKYPDFCIIGIKLICDGTVDGCTAALKRPYPGSADPASPLWPAGDMNDIVFRAAREGLQVAIHAIGDAAVEQAINAIARAKAPSGRHRIEHLEVTSHEDALRLGQLGITASVQPVHSDPSILKDYPRLVGDELWKRAFAYKDFLDGGACVAFGTDAPTAIHLPIPNLYNATTRRSAMEPEMTETTNPGQVFTMSQAFYAATSGAAYSRFAEDWTGSLKPGMRADFVVLDSKWTPDSLLESVVEQTWGQGKLLFKH